LRKLNTTQMKKLLLLKNSVLLFFISINTFSQTSWWTWVKGSDTIHQYGNYGTLGISSVTNTLGGRANSVNWTDLQGNLWLFSGDRSPYVSSGHINDLWKYDVTTNQWTWIKGDSAEGSIGIYGAKGIPSIVNKPGCRDKSTGWVDNNGDFWVFGGNGKGDGSSTIGYLNDIWRYNIATNQWTWISGDNTINSINIYSTSGVFSPNNKPCGRCYSASWVDTSGMVWVFGGQSDLGFLNDLWKYNPTNNQWAWIKGDLVINTNGVYGNIGVPDTLNKPGARVDMAHWYDANNNCLWIFGGWGYDKNANSSKPLNDLWKYDIASNTWAWLSGSDINSQPDIYGALGISSSSNIPGARSGSKSFKHTSTGELFLYGGGNGSGRYNDLWKYNIINNTWTWIKGKNGTNEYGNYGTQGIATASNIPGARYAGNIWSNQNGDLWLFGGSGFAKAAPAGYLNDLWKLENYTITNNGDIKNDDLSLFIYPNPNNGIFTLEAKIEGIYSIINELGQVVKKIQLNSTNNYTINIEDLNTGIYFIVGNNDNQMVKQKIVVTK